jgi:hypothetical protein
VRAFIDFATHRLKRELGGRGLGEYNGRTSEILFYDVKNALKIAKQRLIAGQRPAGRRSASFSSP